MDIPANLKDYLLLLFFLIYAVLLPGYLLTRLLLSSGQLRRLSGYLPGFERGVLRRYFYYLFAPATGLILLDANVLLLSKLQVALSFNNYFYSFAVVNLILIVLNHFVIKSHKVETRCNASLQNGKYKLFFITFALLFLASVFIRTVFYLPDVVPQDTDLGHHMYWSQWMVQKETFPTYDTPEVIEGEHMIFAVMSKLSGITLLSALPLIILSFYNLTMILGLALSALALTSSRKVALWSLFFSGIYFAIDPPQARYVKGGVIGNTFGNLFIVLVFLLVFMFFRYFFKYLTQGRDVAMQRLYQPVISLVSLILIIIAGLFYTHHLSAFLLGIILAASFIFWIVATFVFHGRDALQRVSTRIALSPKFILTCLVIAIFPLFIYLPHYLANQAVDTVTQTPIKDTHQGLPLTNLPGKLGWFRLFFLVVGLSGIILIAYRLLSRDALQCVSTKNVKIAKTRLLSISLVFFGWLLPLAILSFAPQILRIDLPSQRVINYLIFPCVLIAAIGADKLFGWMIKNYRNKKIAILAVIFGLAVLWEGTGDFRSVYKVNESKFQDAVELYSASHYLAGHTAPNAQILKDHRTVAGDSWIKFFFLRGYDYLISRTYDYKYNAIDSQLDPCTREMIIVPGSSPSQKCYGQTGINYVIVKPDGEEYLFWKEQGFNAIYLSDNLAIFAHSD